LGLVTAIDANLHLGVEPAAPAGALPDQEVDPRIPPRLRDRQGVHRLPDREIAPHRSSPPAKPAETT